MNRRSFLLQSAAAVVSAAPTGRVIVDEDFAAEMKNWWSEGGERVWVEDGRLHVKADNPKIPGGAVSTVWLRTPVTGDFRLETEAHVVSSTIAANNINLFFCYSDPSGKPLEETRESRRNAEYNLYHKLNGYIVTFLNDFEGEGGRHPDGSTKARYRIRRNPGFNLLSEKFADHCREGVTYRIGIVKSGGDIRLSIDGADVLSARDPDPLPGGLIGLRTFRTHLWWDNLRVTTLRD
jgi:hypothetical protein